MIDMHRYDLLILILFSLFVASIFYQVVEQPFWRGKFSKYNPAKVILSSSFAITLTSTVLVSLSVKEAPVDSQELSLKVRQATKDLPVLYQYNCDTWYHSSEVQPCVFSDKAYQRTLVLWGDSILAQWFSLFSSIYSLPEWRIIVLTKSACPMVDEDFYYKRIGSIFTVCNDWRSKVLDFLDTIQPEIIIVGSGASSHFSRDQWVDGSLRIFKRLSAAAKQVYVIPGTPALAFNGPGCLLRQLDNRPNSANTTSLAKRCSSKVPESNAQISAYLQEASSRVERVKLLDLNHLVCPNATCSALSPTSQVTFRDNRHLTDKYVRELQPAVKRMIRSMYPD